MSICPAWDTPRSWVFAPPPPTRTLARPTGMRTPSATRPAQCARRARLVRAAAQRPAPFKWPVGSAAALQARGDGKEKTQSRQPPRTATAPSPAAPTGPHGRPFRPHRQGPFLAPRRPAGRARGAPRRRGQGGPSSAAGKAALGGPRCCEHSRAPPAPLPPVHRRLPARAARQARRACLAVPPLPTREPQETEKLHTDPGEQALLAGRSAGSRAPAPRPVPSRHGAPPSPAARAMAAQFRESRPRRSRTTCAIST